MGRFTVATLAIAISLAWAPSAWGAIIGNDAVASHTTYAIVSFSHTNRTPEPPDAAAVAVLVRGSPEPPPTLADAVMWFDDSHLHHNDNYQLSNQRPLCEGSVWVVQEGSGLAPQSPVRTFTLTDPNGIYWEVTKYSQNLSLLDPPERVVGTGAWGYAYGVNVLSSPHSAGPGCHVTQHVTRYDPVLDPLGQPVDADNDGEWDATSQQDAFSYNAVLYLELDDFQRSGAVDHGNKDANGGYSPGANDGDDTRDGNSHPYNPQERADHGERHGHDTYRVDVYWSHQTVERANEVIDLTSGGYHGH